MGPKLFILRQEFGFLITIALLVHVIFSGTLDFVILALVVRAVFRKAQPFVKSGNQQEMLASIVDLNDVKC